MDDLFNSQSFSSFSNHASDGDDRNQYQHRNMIGNDSTLLQEKVCPRLSSSSVTSVSDNMLQQHYVSNNFATGESTSQQQVVLPSLQVALQEPGTTSNIFPPSTTVPNRFIFTNLYHEDRSNGYIDLFSSMMSSAQNHTCFSLSQQDTAASEQYARQQEEEEEHTNFNDMPSTNEAANNKQKKKLGRKKKKEGAPKRPMSAYNFYFQQERKRLLKSLPQQDDAVRKSKRQRKDRSPHHKISFSTLGQTIAKKWKQLDSKDKARYDELASKDTDRYLLEMKVFEAKEKQKATRDLVDSSTEQKRSESSSISCSSSATTSKNQCVASANQSQEQGHHATSAPSIQHDLQNDSKQQETNTSGSSILPNNAKQYSNLLYPHQVGRSHTCDNARSFTNNVTNYEAPQQNSFPSNFESHHQQPLSQSMMMMSTNQECQQEAALSKSIDAKDT